MPKTIDHSRYMQALGLFTMARLHADRAREFQDELIEFLSADDCGNIADAVWQDGAGPKELNRALELEGFTVEAETR